VKIIRETTRTTTLLEFEGAAYVRNFEGAAYVRNEDNSSICWKKELMPDSYEYFKSTGKWYELTVNGDLECELPELERKYQELKSCN
jgi:hypothetical protein